MKKIIIVLTFTIPILTQAQETTFKNEYKPQPGLSFIGGIQYNKNFEAAAPVYGIEISMECPLIQTGKSLIRQQFSIIRQEGKELKTLAVEINPRYKVISKPSFELGAGPGAGLIFVKAGEEKKTIFSYGAGAHAIYFFKKFFIGFESRYFLTKKVSFSNLNSKPGLVETGSLNNLRTFIKFGYRFYK
jgi:hypothetical protein